jgi:hypothetical protein
MKKIVETLTNQMEVIEVCNKEGLEGFRVEFTWEAIGENGIYEEKEVLVGGNLTRT